MSFMEDAVQQRLKRAHWEAVTTDTGVHLRLKGGNGETVLISQPYDDPRSIHEALAVVAAASAFDVVEVDEREPAIPPYANGSPDQEARRDGPTP